MAILIPSDAFPLVYLRYTLSAINLLFLPGYAFTRALFTLAEKPQTINTVERVGLSIGVSLALDAILGLILNFTPWRITVIPVGFGLTFMVVTFALAALVGEHKSM